MTDVCVDRSQCSSLRLGHRRLPSLNLRKRKQRQKWLNVELSLNWERVLTFWPGHKDSDVARDQIKMAA
jgi:hypothetical protein